MKRLNQSAVGVPASLVPPPPVLAALIVDSEPMKEGLTFHLLADPAHNVVEAYGSLGNFMGIKIASRNTFLIDPAGKIAKVWTKVEVQHHSEEVLTAINELKK